MKIFEINVCIWNEINCVSLAWFILPFVLFKIDRVSLECMSLTPVCLTWPVDGLVGLWYSRVGIVPSAVLVYFIL